MAKIDLKDYLERLEEPEDREAVASREYQKELFEQYVQKGDNFPELRAQLLKEYQDGADLTGPQGLRRKLGAFDLGYFGRAYLPLSFIFPRLSENRSLHFLRCRPIHHRHRKAHWGRGLFS